jgi:hypothetical protein
MVASRNVVRRWGAGTAGIVRVLIAARVPLTGVAVAGLVGVSQPRASQVLGRLVADGALRVTADGYVGVPEKLLDLYRLRSRPVLVGPELFWYSTRSGLDQAARVIGLAASAGAKVAFSADLGPDLLVPWRHPTLSVVYASDVLDLNGVGFVLAEGRADASVIVRCTSDALLLVPVDPWPKVVDGVTLTDPTQQWWDLLDLGGEDRVEAAARLRGAILTHTIPGEL